MPSAQTVYEDNVRPLPPMERLRLAKIILEQLTGAEGSDVDLSDCWSEQDIVDVTAFSMGHAAKTVPGEERDV